MILSPSDFEPAMNIPFTEDAQVHVFIKDMYVQRMDGELATRWGEFRWLGLPHIRCHCLGHRAGVPHFALALPDDVKPEAIPEPFKAQGLRNWFGQLPEEHLGIAMRAVQILNWDREHRFCGSCGTPPELTPGERAKKCPACGLLVYPRISPAMMTLVTRGRELLLARGVNFPPGRFSALAGFLEAGETIEQSIHREVFEEVGIKVRNLQYFASQTWPFPNSLMIAFTAEYESGEIQCDPAEIAEAHWYTPENLPQLPPRFSVSRELINATVSNILKGA